MDYGKILKRAWQIIWQHKVLWIFGILAGCAQGGGGGGGGSGMNQKIPTNTSGQNGGAVLPQAFQPIIDFFQDPSSVVWIVAIVVALVCVIFLLSIIGLFLGTIGKIGLVRGTLAAEKIVTLPGTEKITFGGLFKSSLPFFWRVFLLNLLLGIGWFVAIVAFAVMLILSILGICLLIPYCCLLIPLGWLFRVFTEQANLALIIENLSITDAIGRGWEMTKEHFGDLIVMGLILILGGAIAGLVMALPIVLICIPLVVGMIAGENAMAVGVGISVVCLLLYIPLFILLNGVLQAFVESSWTLTFLELKKKMGALAVAEETTPVIPSVN